MQVSALPPPESALATLIGENVRFLHVPKTGGTWATEAMFAAGVKVDKPLDVPFHGDLRDTRPYADRFTFAFVRHPLEFWRSYWGYRMRTGWLEDFPIDAAASSDFNEFVERLVDGWPGWAGELYERYVGPPAREIDMICRHERLADDLCAALRLAGVRFDEAGLRAKPALNANDYETHPALYRRRTAQLLAEAEAPAIDRFYPWEPIPERLLDAIATRPAGPSRALRRLRETEIELRDARARIAALERSHSATEQCLAATEAKLRGAEQSLARIHSSRLLRWSRPLRILWYRALRGTRELADRPA